jgi:hypothetical protein
MTGTRQAGSRGIKLNRSFRCLFLIILAGSVALLGTFPTRAAESTTVTFSLDFPNSDPDHYSIAVQSDGHAHYECSAVISEASDERETYQTEFTLSDATRARIFDLTAQSHYFSGKVDSGNRKLAFTGAKKLAYKDSQRESAAEYNFSSQPVIQQLTTLFQSIAATLEFGRRLAHYHRFQKLALDDELKKMEDEARRGNLIEIPAVKPVLLEIHNDSSVMNVVRVRAQRIIDMGYIAPAPR